MFSSLFSMKFSCKQNNIFFEKDIELCFFENVNILMQQDILVYNESLSASDQEICNLLADIIDESLHGAERKIWHAHPVWFLDGNPIVGYSRLKHEVRLLFWSGQSFDEPSLLPEGKFKAAELRYTDASQIDRNELLRMLEKAARIQWDYKNIVKRKGRLELISG